LPYFLFSKSKFRFSKLRTGSISLNFWLKLFRLFWLYENPSTVLMDLNYKDLDPLSFRPLFLMRDSLSKTSSIYDWLNSSIIILTYSLNSSGFWTTHFTSLSYKYRTLRYSRRFYIFSDLAEETITPFTIWNTSSSDWVFALGISKK